MKTVTKGTIGFLLISVTATVYFAIFQESQSGPSNLRDFTPGITNETCEESSVATIRDETLRSEVRVADSSSHPDVDSTGPQNRVSHPFVLDALDYGFDFYHLLATDDENRLRSAFSRPPFVEQGTRIDPVRLRSVVSKYRDDCRELKELSERLMNTVNSHAREQFDLGLGEQLSTKVEFDPDGTPKEVGTLPERRSVSEIVSVVSDGSTTRVIRSGWNDRPDIDELRHESKLRIERLVNSVRADLEGTD